MLVNVALNKITGTWNEELLADLIQDLKNSDFDEELTGFEPPEIDRNEYEVTNIL